MNKLQTGFARVNITPMMGIELSGYFFERPADGVLDDIEVNALAFACGETRAVILTVDNEGLSRDITTDFRQHISEQTGLQMESIYIHATHSHTAPLLKKDSNVEIEKEYYNKVQYYAPSKFCTRWQQQELPYRQFQEHRLLLLESVHWYLIQNPDP